MERKIKNKPQPSGLCKCLQCPGCNGEGQVRLEDFVVPIYQTCKACNGTKIISMYIILQWFPCEPPTGYSEEMIVMKSNHKRFITGSRFDYGFFNIATREGYTIISVPKQ